MPEFLDRKSPPVHGGKDVKISTQAKTMTITDLLPTVKELSHADKLLLLQTLVQELIDAEGINNNQPSNSLDEPTEMPLTSETPDLSEQLEVSLTEDEEDSLALKERYTFLKKTAGRMPTHPGRAS